MIPGATLIHAALLLTEPHRPLTRTQNCRLLVGLNESVLVVPPLVGLLVSPLAPWYHWYVRFVPVAVTRRLFAWPLLDAEVTGCWVITGGEQIVTVAVLLLAVAQGPVTRHQ